MTVAEALEAPTPISVALEGVWVTSQIFPEQIIYNETVSFRKRGPLQVDALREAFNGLVRRYDSWHSVVGRTNGEPTLIGQPPMRFALPLIDLSRLDEAAAERRAVQIVAAVARLPYDLSRGPLIRPRLVRIAAEDYRLYVAAHHVAVDGISLARTVLPELVDLYDAVCAGRGVELDQPAANYADYARWERRWMASDRAAQRVEYWRRRLTPAPPRLDLPSDASYPGAARGLGGTVPVLVPPGIAEALRGTARASHHTEFQAYAAIWATLLHRLTGETDISFGTPADLRRRRELEPVVGFCLSPLVLRVDLSQDPVFSELVTTLRNELLDALDHLVPFERVVRDLKPVANDDDGNPFYQTMFVLEPGMAAAIPTWSLHQLDPPLADALGVAKVDLELLVDALPDGSFVGQLNYDGAFFTREAAERLIRVWLKLVEAFAADPGLRISQVPLTDTADEARLAEFNTPGTDDPGGAVTQQFAEVAGRQPSWSAVTAGDLTVSYGELEAMALVGAGQLRAAGVQDADTIAVCMAPSVELVAATLAVLNAGASVLLLDPLAPAELLRERVSAAGCAAAVVGDASPASVAGLAARTLRWSELTRSGATASVTADPELVCMLAPDPRAPESLNGLTHQVLGRLAPTLVTALDLGPGETVLVLADQLYESPWTELWPTLLAGGRLLLAPPEVGGHGTAVSALVRAEHVTFVHATAVRWEAMIDTGFSASRGLRALSSGEPLSRELADRLLERCRVLWAAHAPGVPGAYCTLGRIERNQPVSIGRPLADHRAQVMDTHGRPVPVGFVGELWLDGPVVGDGTVRRTGRRARWLSDGNVELLAGCPAASEAA